MTDEKYPEKFEQWQKDYVAIYKQYMSFQNNIYQKIENILIIPIVGITAYIFQSLFYALVGSVIGLLLLYVILVPYFDANPINFPFSDGILVAPLGSTMFRITLLVLTTVIAGFIPARIVVKKNTLDSILGRR